MCTKTISYPINHYLSISIILTLISHCYSLCEPGGFCREMCTEEDPCINQVIDFSTATAGSRLDCYATNTCINITLVCPVDISEIPCAEQPCDHHCEIRGYGGVFQSLNNWKIIARNSWDDLTVTNFNAYIQGTMFCTDPTSETEVNFDGSCAMQYGLWNCEYDPSNACFRQQTNEEFVNCTGNTQCQGKTDLGCTDITEGDPTGVCNVICSGEKSCMNSTITCGNRRECTVLCTGVSSCMGAQGSTGQSKTNIFCGSNGSEQNCTIICGSENVTGSCMHIDVNKGLTDLRGNLNVNAMGNLQLVGSVIYGPDYGDVNVQCNGVQSCNEAKFVANNSVTLNIGCNSDGVTCDNMHVYCPLKTENCLISGTAMDAHTDLQIYARGGWNDLSITDEYKSTAVATGESMLHCGSQSYYDASCLIDQDWYCECPGVPTKLPTVAPSMSEGSVPTVSPTDGGEDGMSERQKNGYIVGGVFVGFVISCLVCVVYWYCCVHHKAGQSSQNYESVGNNAGDNEQNDGGKSQTNVAMSKSKSKSKSKKGVRNQKESQQTGNEVIEENKNDMYPL